jgi:alkylated DNA repair dioxygenase AlkB
MPELVTTLARKIEFHGGHPRGYLNNAMATVYESGDKQYIPLHQDRSHSKEATGKIEDTSPIYNVSFLATRTFVLAGLEHTGKKDRKDFAGGIIREWPMASGDLVVLPPRVNATTVHGVPRERDVAEKLPLCDEALGLRT